MISPQVISTVRRCPRARHAYDPAMAKGHCLPRPAIRTDFEVGMDCPNNRYVNDERICTCGDRDARPHRNQGRSCWPNRRRSIFKKVLGPAYETSFYLLGWTPGNFDSWNVLYNLVHCRQEASGAGKFNLGNYCNPDLDALNSSKSWLKTDATQRRNAMIAQAYRTPP